MFEVVVTGAASGIGAATVRVLAEKGIRVWCLDRDETGLRSVADSVVSPAVVCPIVVDVSSEKSVRAAFREIAKNTGAVNGLVNSAGVSPGVAFDALTCSEWRRVFDINVLGCFLTTKYALPLLRGPRQGSIVNLASAAGKLPGPYFAHYAASKAAVISLTRSSAAALAPGVRVNCVCPGIVDTPMWEALDRDMERMGAPLRFHSRAAQTPAERPAAPSEVANVIAFLLSDEASFITGEDVNVSGGMIMY
jgi:NAD(P)-dependent dehydrogenase (short-subunit alcohol dehydrogenase family)